MRQLLKTWYWCSVKAESRPAHPRSPINDAQGAQLSPKEFHISLAEKWTNSTTLAVTFCHSLHRWSPGEANDVVTEVITEQLPKQRCSGEKAADFGAGKPTVEAKICGALAECTPWCCLIIRLRAAAPPPLPITGSWLKKQSSKERVMRFIRLFNPRHSSLSLSECADFLDIGICYENRMDIICCKGNVLEANWRSPPMS